MRLRPLQMERCSSALKHKAVAKETIIKFILLLEQGPITNVTYMLGNNSPQTTTVEGRNHSQLPTTSASARVLEADDQFARPARSACNLLSSGHIQSAELIIQQPLQTTKLFTERSRQKHNRMALFVLKLQSCGLTLLRTGTSQRGTRPCL